MNSIKNTRRIGGKKQLGQGMTEYIIIVALVAIGAIGVYNMFGKTVRDQTSAMALGLAGDDTGSKGQSTQAGTDSGKAKDRAGDLSLKDFGKDSGQ